MKPKHKVYTKEKNNKEDALRRKVRELEKEIERLKGELKTLNKAFEKSAKFMSDESKELSVEDLIIAADKHKTLQEAKEDYEKLSQQEVRDKWKKWRESLNKEEDGTEI